MDIALFCISRSNFWIKHLGKLKWKASIAVEEP